MEPDERQRFGAFIRRLREELGLSLRDVEATVQGIRLSNSYLYQIERGDRNPPRAEIMRELARVYQVPLSTLMAAAGYEDKSSVDPYKDLIDRAYEFVRKDAKLKYGMQAEGDTLSLESKRFIIEMYEQVNPGIKLLNMPRRPSTSDDDEDEVDEDE